MNQSPQVEWEKLHHRQCRLRDRITTLEHLALNPPLLPKIQALLLQQEHLNQECRQKCLEIKMRRRKVEFLRSLINTRRRAASGDMKASWHLHETLQDLQRKMQELPPTATELTMQQGIDMLWACQAPPGAVFSHLAKDEEMLAAACAAEANLHQQLETLAVEYRLTKKKVRRVLEAKRAELQQLLVWQLAWATSSAERLEFFVKVEPLRAQQALSLYRQRHPALPVNEVPRPSYPQTPARTWRGRKKFAPSKQPRSTLSCPLPTWRFFVTDNSAKVGDELPSQALPAIQALEQFIQTLGLENLAADLLYNKLMAVTTMTVQQRQQIQKLAGVAPIGWKKIRASKRYRILFEINENERTIRLLIRPRSDAYNPRRHH